MAEQTGSDRKDKADKMDRADVESTGERNQRILHSAVGLRVPEVAVGALKPYDGGSMQIMGTFRMGPPESAFTVVGVRVEVLTVRYWVMNNLDELGRIFGGNEIPDETWDSDDTDLLEATREKVRRLIGGTDSELPVDQFIRYWWYRAVKG